jgi:hypothetical protein
MTNRNFEKGNLPPPLPFPVSSSPFPVLIFDPNRGTGNPDPETEKSRLARSKEPIVFGAETIASLSPYLLFLPLFPRGARHNGFRTPSAFPYGATVWNRESCRKSSRSACVITL